MSSFKILQSAQLRVPLGHEAEDRIAHREVSEAFLKTDLFFTRGNKPNRGGISSTSQRKTTLEGEESCKCCLAKLEAFLVNLFSLRRERDHGGDEGSVWRHSQPTDPQNISVYIPELPPCHHSVILPLVHPTTFSAGRVYRGDPTANPMCLRQDLKAAWNTNIVSSHKRPHKHPRDTNCPVGMCHRFISCSHLLAAPDLVCSEALSASQSLQLVWRNSETEFLLPTANTCKAFASCCNSFGSFPLLPLILCIRQGLKRSEKLQCH